jgi:hypothetical protein
MLMTPVQLLAGFKLLLVSPMVRLPRRRREDIIATRRTYQRIHLSITDHRIRMQFQMQRHRCCRIEDMLNLEMANTINLEDSQLCNHLM